MKSLRLYKTGNGKMPFAEWVHAIRDHITVAQINNRVRRLTLGQWGDYKRIDRNVFELRIHYGPGYRVYFAQHGNNVIILLLGGNKGTQKRDIKRALAYWQDYQEQYYEKSQCRESTSPY